MVRRFPVAGAEFAYAYRAGGRYHAYVCGWLLTLGYLSIVPLNATALSVLARFVAPDLVARGHLYTVAGFDVFAGEVLLASTAIVVVAIFHYCGVRGVGGLQVLLTSVLVGAVLIIGVGTSFSETASVDHWRPLFPSDRSPLAAVLAIVAISPWLYVGFDTLPQAAEEFDFSPGRGRRLMVWSILTGAVMYAVLILATASVTPWEGLVASEPLWATGTTVRDSLGPAGLVILATAVATAVITGINGFFMATSRLIFSMGRARLLPGWFARVHPVHGTPTSAILFTAAASLAAPWFGREVIVWVVDMSAVGTAVGYGYTCSAAYAISTGAGPDRSPSDRVVAAAGAALSATFIWLLCVPGMPAFMAAPSWMALGAWVALGGAFYLVRAVDYASLPTATLDRLILGDPSLVSASRVGRADGR